MGRKGRFAHAYDDAPVHRLQADEGATAELRSHIAQRLAGFVSAAAEDVAAEHGIQADVALLLVAQQVYDAADFVRWAAAGQARAASIPIRGLMDAMGYSSPTSITRMVPLIDQVAGAQAIANQTGEPVSVSDENGFTLTLQPGGGLDIETARRRGYLD